MESYNEDEFDLNSKTNIFLIEFKKILEMEINLLKRVENNRSQLSFYLKQCNDDFKNLDGKLFLEDYSHIHSNKTDVLFKKEFLLDKIINKLKSTCDHKWEHDIIDLNYDTSTKITYCKKCEITI